VIPEDWEVTKVGEVANVKTGPFGSSLHERDYVTDGTPIITVEHLGEQGVFHYNLPMVSDIDKKRLNRYILQTNDIVFSRVGSIDRNSLISQEENGWLFSGRLLRIRLESKHNVASFLSYNFQQESTKQRIRSVAVGQTMASLNTQILKNISISLPPTKAEQTAIATALSDADALIQSLEKLIAKKRNIKQGAMQELLRPEKCEKVKLLGEICEINKGQLITSNDIVFGDVPVIAGGKSPAYYHNKPNRLGRTITISASGANAGYVAFHKTPIFASDCSTIEESDNYSIEFIFYLLCLKQKEIYATQSGGAQPHIHPIDLYPIETPILDIEEQQNIATILSDMDAEISALEAKLAKYKQVKQGMMQELLTGKTRLV